MRRSGMTPINRACLFLLVVLIPAAAWGQD